MIGYRSLSRKARIKGVQTSLSLARRWYAHRRGEGFDMMTADWDLLVLLDACHPDILREELDGELGPDANVDTRHSLGSDSSAYLRRQFACRSLHDTVYVTGNPYLSSIPAKTFHATDNVLADGFDQKLGTVPPEIMSRRTLDALQRYPDKRVVAHFMQPHFPFLGETGERFEHSGLELGTPTESDAPNPWFAAMYGTVDSNDILAAYRENHRIIIEHVAELLDSVSDRVVVSADHANLIGQRLRPVPIKAYGHPSGLAHPDLTRVPWVEIPASETRRSVSTDPPVVERETDDDLSAKLAALGYG